MSKRNSQNWHISVSSAIRMYERLFKAGKIKREGAAWKRLMELYDIHAQKRDFRSNESS